MVPEYAAALRDGARDRVPVADLVPGDSMLLASGDRVPADLRLKTVKNLRSEESPFDPQSRLRLLPIEPVQILWIYPVATVALALPLAFEAKESEIMHRPPRDPRAPVLPHFVVWRTVLAALLITAGAIWVFKWYFDPFLNTATAASGTPLAKAQTMAVTTLIMLQIF
jgi:Ca2+-transporting ATPase